MSRGPGLSGLAVALAAAGGILVYSAIRNASVSDTLRALLKGQPVQGETAGSVAEARAQIGTSLAGAIRAASPGGAGQVGVAPDAGGTSHVGNRGDQIVAAARAYLGRPYVWAAAGPDAFDCSGLVTWVLHHDLGINLPSNGHTVVSQFLVWSGATTVPRSATAPGDLVIYGGTHIGIAIDATHMIHAPQPGEVVKISTIWGGPTIRRVN